MFNPISASRALSSALPIAFACLAGGFPALAASPPPVQQPAAAAVDPRATAALDRMSSYLASLTAFEVTSDATQDLVLEDGHTVKLGVRTSYVVQTPQRLYAEVHGDRQHRNYYFDGATLTMTAPRLGYYASVPAEVSLGGLVDVLASDYGIDLPLADLFLWNARSEDTPPPQAAAVIGYADVDGQETDQYLFVGPEAEWQIWIKRGDQPLPLRMVVTDTTDPARPQFAADLTWNLSPQIAQDRFTFTPPAAAKRIVFGELSTEEDDQ